MSGYMAQCDVGGAAWCADIGYKVWDVKCSPVLQCMVELGVGGCQVLPAGAGCPAAAPSSTTL